MSVRPFSKEFIQFGFLWLKKKKNDYTQSILCSIPSSGETSLGLLPPSAEFILYKVIVIFIKIANVTFAN